MNKWLVALAVVSATPLIAAAKPRRWERYNDVSVIWAKSRGLAAIRFDGESAGPESGCSPRTAEIVTVISHQLHTKNGADDLFRGRAVNKHVNSYRIPLNDAPNVISGWFEELIEEGRRVRVYSNICGSGGFIYVNKIDSLN